RNDNGTKIAVMSFSVHYSNITLNKNFALLMYNVFEYFIPSTVSSTSFEVNDEIVLRSRGNDLEVRIGDVVTEFAEFPAKIKATVTGTYEITQSAYESPEYVFVKVPVAESNMFTVNGDLRDPYGKREQSDFLKDLLVYIAAALVAILFAEWWLHTREDA
ncbi:MAG: hypothetical protein MJ072_02040, partial [Clostridia bacterium]|nr:hypothetical protein [Clostridia bacterium]